MVDKSVCVIPWSLWRYYVCNIFHGIVQLKEALISLFEQTSLEVTYSALKYLGEF